MFLNSLSFIHLHIWAIISAQNIWLGSWSMHRVFARQYTKNEILCNNCIEVETNVISSLLFLCIIVWGYPPYSFFCTPQWRVSFNLNWTLKKYFSDDKPQIVWENYMKYTFLVIIFFSWLMEYINKFATYLTFKTLTTTQNMLNRSLALEGWNAKYLCKQLDFSKPDLWPLQGRCRLQICISQQN